MPLACYLLPAPQKDAKYGFWAVFGGFRLVFYLLWGAQVGFRVGASIIMSGRGGVRVDKLGLESLGVSFRV